MVFVIRPTCINVKAVNYHCRMYNSLNLIMLSVLFLVKIKYYLHVCYIFDIYNKQKNAAGSGSHLLMQHANVLAK